MGGLIVCRIKIRGALASLRSGRDLSGLCLRIHILLTVNLGMLYQWLDRREEHEPKFRCPQSNGELDVVLARRRSHDAGIGYHKRWLEELD